MIKKPRTKANKGKLRSPRQIKERRTRLLIRTGVMGIVTILLVVGVVLIMRSSGLRIFSITVEGTKITDEEHIEAVVREELQGNYVWVLPKTNSFLVPDEVIERRLVDMFPRLSYADVSLQKVGMLRVDVEERQHFALWCRNSKADEDSTEEHETCYFLDKTGVIFSSAPYFSGGTFFRFYGGVPATNPVGRKYRSTETFTRLVEFIDLLEEIDLDPQELHLERGSDVYAVVWSRENELLRGTEILFDTDDDLEVVAENIEIILTDAIFDPLHPDAVPMERIDARFEDRIFYKQVGE